MYDFTFVLCNGSRTRVKGWSRTVCVFLRDQENKQTRRKLENDSLADGKICLWLRARKQIKTKKAVWNVDDRHLSMVSSSFIESGVKVLSEKACLKILMGCT